MAIHEQLEKSAGTRFGAAASIYRSEGSDMAVVIPFPKRNDWEPWLTKRELASILRNG